MLLEEVRFFANFQLLASKAKEGFMAGLHKSPFRGFSVEFAEHRPYNPGESSKHLDWKLLARTDKKYTKQFNEETNLKAQIWIDTSNSMRYPSIGELKLKFSALAAAVIATILQKQKDSFALGFYNEKGFHHRSPIKSTPSHCQQTIVNLLPLWESKEIPIPETYFSLEEVAIQVSRRSLVLLFTDLIWHPSEHESEALFWKTLAQLRFHKCEIVLFHISHQVHELSLDLGNRPLKFIDLETQETIKLQPDEVQGLYQKRALSQQKDIEERCLQLGIEYCLSDVSEPLEKLLNAFFVKRSRMM